MKVFLRIRVTPSDLHPRRCWMDTHAIPSIHTYTHLSTTSLMNTMDAYRIESNTSIMLSHEVDDGKVIDYGYEDYGYEDHGPDTRRHDVVDVDPVLKIAAPTTYNFCVADNFTSISSHGKDSLCASGVLSTDATEVSQSPSQRMKGMCCPVGTVSDVSSLRGQGFNQNTGRNYDEDDDDDDEDDDDEVSVMSQDDDVIDYEEVIRATARSVEENEMTTDDTALYPPMPPDRQARKQRSFRRRGGELHGALLKSAVMASMSFDYDDSNDEADQAAGGDTEKFPMGRFRDTRRESCQSSISLQSLQDALRSESSPRKRARRGQRRKSFDDDDDEIIAAETSNDKNDDAIEASDLFVNMRVGAGRANSGAAVNSNRSSGNSSSRRTNSSTSHFHSSISSSISDFTADAAAVAAEIVREAPPRRVSRKTSYDSRASDYDSDDWDL